MAHPRLRRLRTAGSQGGELVRRLDLPHLLRQGHGQPWTVSWLRRRQAASRTAARRGRAVPPLARRARSALDDLHPGGHARHRVDQKRAVRAFLVWAMANGHSPRLTLPQAPGPLSRQRTACCSAADSNSWRAAFA